MPVANSPRAVPRPQSAKRARASKRSSSTPGGPRQTSAVGALLNHEPPAARKDHARDNVRKMREKAKQQRVQREEEAAREKPAFKLRQFDNVPSRLYQAHRRSSSTPSRPSSAPAEGPSASRQTRRVSMPSSPSSEATPGWRVSNGFGSLQDTPQRLANCPPTPETPGTPPRAMQARSTSTPAKSPKRDTAVRALFAPKSRVGNRSAVTGDDDEGGFDAHSFEKVAKHLKENARPVRAKDAQGRPTHLQQHRDSPQGPLSHSGEVSQDAIPVGFRLLPDEEREENLAELQSKLAQANDQYCRLPLRIETEGQRKSQVLLKKTIEDTEKAVAVFSRRAVLVER